MRRTEDFRRTVRRGVRIGLPTLVLHAVDPARGTTPLDPRRAHATIARGATPLDPRNRERARASATGIGEVRVGFVVGKAVGNAVTRNRVRRRLRHLAAAHIRETPSGVDVVVRALPPAATAKAELPADLASAWSQALDRLGCVNSRGDTPRAPRGEAAEPAGAS